MTDFGTPWWDRVSGAVEIVRTTTQYDLWRWYLRKLADDHQISLGDLLEAMEQEGLVEDEMKRR